MDGLGWQQFYATLISFSFLNDDDLRDQISDASDSTKKLDLITEDDFADMMYEKSIIILRRKKNNK